MSPKLKKQFQVKTFVEIEHPVFSFKYLTTNKKYTMKSLTDLRERERAFSAFFHCIHKMEACTWQTLHQQNKKEEGGIETLKFKDIFFSPKNYTLQDNEKVLSIRFARGKYRIIAFKKPSDPTCYIIGFDFYHNAYNHGS